MREMSQVTRFWAKAYWKSFVRRHSGLSNPSYVRDKLERTVLQLKSNDDRDATIQLIKSYGNKKDIKTLRRMQTENVWINNDIRIANTLIRSYAKCGAVKDAEQIFEQLKERDVVSWSALIAGYVDLGLANEALTCLREMENDGVTPDSVTYVCSLKACAILGSLKVVEDIHSQVREQSLLNKHIPLGNSLVNAYAKCGSVKQAQEVFDQLEHQDIVSWSSLIAGYTEQGFGQDALLLFKEMENEALMPNSVAYACILKACALEGAVTITKEIHTIVREEGLLSKDINLGTALVNAYAKCRALKEARKVFEQLPEQDVVAWSALIDGYAEQGFSQEALTCFKEMENDGVIPNAVTYICCLKACAVAGPVEIIEEIHAKVRDQGILKNHIVLANALVNAYVKCGAMKEAREVFDQLGERNIVSWNALIAGYAEQGFCEEALTCFREMEDAGVAPDSVTYTCCLTACSILGALKIVEEIHSQVRKEEMLNKHTNLGNALVNAFAKCGALREAQEVFNHIAKRSVVSWNALIDGYVEQGFCEEALKYFKEMESDGVRPDSVTYTCSLKACAITGALDIVEEIHNQIREERLVNKHTLLGTTLVYAYSKCGAVKEALEVFDQLEERNIESWTALLAGYAQLAQVNEMLKLVNRMMREGIFPDSVIFLVLLNGCSHGASLEEGERLFCMIEKHDIAPSAEHYTCMVDLFGRAGQFDKAKCFVLHHSATLLAYLGACQKWEDVDIGKWAFDKLLQLDQNCGDAYVCMANIYAASGMMKVED